MNRIIDDMININSFLKLGYFLGYKNEDYCINYCDVDKDKYINCTESDLVDLGIEKLRHAFSKRFQSHKKHVIPLSAGLDSRLILASLLEFTEACNIHTFTFGTPGSYDYDIGTEVANKIGTKHTCFPLTEHKYNIEELLDISKRFDHQVMLFLHGPIWEIDKKFKDFKVWSGCMGDMLSGVHYTDTNTKDIREAKKQFFKINSYVRSIELTNCEEHELLELVSYDSVDNNLVVSEQIAFQNIALKYELPHVVYKGLDFKVPFLDKEWTNFILSVENNYRKNQYIYKKILLKVFPKLFGYPTYVNFGLPLNSSQPNILMRKTYILWIRAINKIKKLYTDPRISYLDFDSAIRYREDLKALIYENIMDLKERKIINWVDIDLIWSRHINKKANYSDALLVLASLELHMKSMGI